MSELQISLLPEVERRAEALRGIPEHHEAEAARNKQWAIRCREELSKASQAMKAEQKQSHQAQASVAENERWAAHSSRADLNALRSVQRSRKWRRDVDVRMRAIQDEIAKQDHDFLTATERVRMHSYLAREAVTELNWLRALKQQLTDATALGQAIAVDF